MSGVVHAIYVGMIQLEHADHVARPGGDATYDAQNDDTGDDTQRMKSEGDRQDPQADLCLEHKDCRTQPSDLGKERSHVLAT